MYVFSTKRNSNLDSKEKSYGEKTKRSPLPAVLIIALKVQCWWVVFVTIDRLYKPDVHLSAKIVIVRASTCLTILEPRYSVTPFHSFAELLARIRVLLLVLVASHFGSVYLLKLVSGRIRLSC